MTMDASESPLALVVDDEPAIGWTLERALAKRGWRTLVAGTAREGLRLAATERPRAIVLDVRLPDDDGLSALPRFREACEAASVIVTTAFGDLPTALRAAHGGAVEFLPKPFDLKRALDVIERVGGVRRQPAPSISTPSGGVHDAFERAAEALAGELLEGNLEAGDLLERMRRPMERALFRAALAKAAGNRVLAARWLGVHRATLRARLESLGLD
jgi:DNA-binding NtrC family response regulator